MLTFEKGTDLFSRSNCWALAQWPSRGSALGQAKRINAENRPVPNGTAVPRGTCLASGMSSQSYAQFAAWASQERLVYRQV